MPDEPGGRRKPDRDYITVLTVRQPHPAQIMLMTSEFDTPLTIDCMIDAVHHHAAQHVKTMLAAA